MTFWQSPLWTANTRSIYRPPQDRDEPGALSDWHEALALFRLRKTCDAVLTMGDRASFCYGLLCALLQQPSRQIMTEVFIDQPHPCNPLWQAKTWLYRHIAAKAIGVLTNSSEEVNTIAKRFALPPEKLRYVPMHTNILHPQAFPVQKGPILSAGRTLRDYPTLLKAVCSMTKSVVIICGHNDLRRENNLTHVQILKDISRQAYLEQLQQASLLVLPLVKTERSTGQVVLLEAMAYGKPVIATRSPGTLDIIRDGENGLLVAPSNPAELQQAIEKLLHHPGQAQKMGANALNDILLHHTIDGHAQHKLDAILSLVAHQSVESEKQLAAP